MEAVRPISDLRRLLSKYLINNLYLSKYDLASEELNTNKNKQNDGHILIKLPRGGKSMTTDPSDKNKNIPLTTATEGLSY